MSFFLSRWSHQRYALYLGRDLLRERGWRLSFLLGQRADLTAEGDLLIALFRLEIQWGSGLPRLRLDSQWPRIHRADWPEQPMWPAIVRGTA